MATVKTTGQGNIKVAPCHTEENCTEFMRMVASIEPVKTELSSEEMVRMLRSGKEQKLYDYKLKVIR